MTEEGLVVVSGGDITCNQSLFVSVTHCCFTGTGCRQFWKKTKEKKKGK